MPLARAMASSCPACPSLLWPPPTHFLPCQCPVFPLGPSLGPGQGVHRGHCGLVTVRDRSGAHPPPPGEQAAVGCSLSEPILDPDGEGACILGNIWGLSWARLLGVGVGGSLRGRCLLLAPNSQAVALRPDMGSWLFPHTGAETRIRDRTGEDVVIPAQDHVSLQWGHLQA